MKPLEQRSRWWNEVSTSRGSPSSFATQEPTDSPRGCVPGAAGPALPRRLCGDGRKVRCPAEALSRSRSPREGRPSRVRHPATRKKPPCSRSRGARDEVGGDVLSHRWTGSTIRATGLNGRVREGNGCVPRAMATNHSRLLIVAHRFVGLPRARCDVACQLRLTRPRRPPCAAFTLSSRPTVPGLLVQQKKNTGKREECQM